MLAGAARARGRARGGSRGYPFLALAALLVLVASPVVSLGGTRPLLLGIALAALTVCFLWLERLPLRPGLGRRRRWSGSRSPARCRSRAAADRGEPWFDYQRVRRGARARRPGALRLGPRRYGPISWPRDGRRGAARSRRREPQYWKAREPRRLRRQRAGRRAACHDPRGPDARALDLPRRLAAPAAHGPARPRSPSGACAATTCVGAGTTLDASTTTPRGDRARRRPGHLAGRSASCARGDSYTRARLRAAPDRRRSSPRGPRRRRREHRRTTRVQVHLRASPAESPRCPPTCRGARRRGPSPQRDGRTSRRSAASAPPRRRLPSADGTTGDGDRGAAATRPTARTWQLAQRLKRGAAHAVRVRPARVDDYLQPRLPLHRAPRAGPPGEAPLESLPVRHQGRLLPALLGRDGAAAAHGRRARARGDRLLARRLLASARGVGRARHRRALVGRGVVRRLRLGHVRPDADRHARRARRSPRSRPRPRRTTAARPGGRRRRRRQHGGATAARRARARSCSTSCAAAAGRRPRTAPPAAPRGCRCGR